MPSDCTTWNIGTTHSRVLQPEIQRLTSFMEAHVQVRAALATFVPAVRQPVQKYDSHSFEELDQLGSVGRSSSRSEAMIRQAAP